MKITIASGKGGTGKTLIATNLAITIANMQLPVQLLDCDVEAPNDHLFLNPVNMTQRPVYLQIPVVDQSKCTLCNQCADVCEFNAISVFGKSVLVFQELCHACGGCTLACPENAINEVDYITGYVNSGKHDVMEFISGELNIGEAKAPPVIKSVKENIKSDMISILDSPPGTSCPAVETLRGSDYIVLVAEDTPFGFNDLKLAITVVKKLDIPFGIVLNKSDTLFKEIKNYARENDILIHVKIPLDRQIAEIYSNGNLLITEIPAFKLTFRKLYEQIKKELII